MSTSTVEFAAEYAEWLTTRLATARHGGVTELSTPLLDVFNDGMRVYIVPTGAGEYLLHDAGITLENLSLQGVDIHASERRTALADTVLRSSGLELNEDRIQTTARESNLAQRIHFLLSAMQRIGDLWLTCRASPKSRDFFEKVCAYLDAHDVLYTQNVTIPGPTVEHPIDIMIPLPGRRDRMVKLMGSPSTQAAKVVSFTWVELENVRPSSDRVVLVNDLGGEGDNSVVSEQAEIILSAYSTHVYRWSQRHEKEFARLWAA